MTKGDFKFPFLDLSQMLAGYNVPGVDFDSIIEMQRRNIEAFAAANQSAGEAMKTMGRRQVEIFRETMEQWQAVAGDMAGQGGTWRDMAGHGRTWPDMGRHGQTWPNMAKHGQTWPNMA